MAYLLSIAFSTGGDDELLLVDEGDSAKQILVGWVNDQGAKLGKPGFVPPRSTDAYPSDLFADAAPVLLEGRNRGSGWQSLCHAIAIALSTSNLALGTVNCDAAGDLFKVTFVADPMANALFSAPAGSPAQAAALVGVHAAAQTATQAPSTANAPINLTLAPTGQLPTSTPANGLAQVGQLITNGQLANINAPLTASWALMQTPNAFGGRSQLIIAPFNGYPGLPAYLIGDFDPSTGTGTIQHPFQALPAGIPLTPLRLPNGIQHIMGNFLVDEDTLETVLEEDLAAALGFDFDKIGYDEPMSDMEGAAIYHTGVWGGGIAPQAQAGAPVHPGLGGPLGGQAQTQPVAGDSTRPADRPAVDLKDAVGKLAGAAKANPALAEKLAAIEGLSSAVKTAQGPEERKPQPGNFFKGGWS